MKNDAIKKINLIGKISKIAVTIAQVLVIIGFVICVCFAIVGFTMSDKAEDSIKINFDATANVSFDNSEFPLSLVDEEIVDEVIVSVAGVEIEKLAATEQGDVLTVVANAGFDLDKLREDLDGVIGLGGILGIACILVSLVIAAAYITLVFAKKLAKAFEKCESPFEENVTKRMKQFAYSIIPWFAVMILGQGLLGTINIMNILLMAIVLLVIYIFNYGAQLQRESDETL